METRNLIKTAENPPSLGLKMMRGIRDELGIFAISAASILGEEIYRKIFRAYLEIPEELDENARVEINRHVGGLVYWQNNLGRRVERLSDFFTGSDSHEKRLMIPELHQVQLAIESLQPSLEGLSIYQITDPHVHSLPSFFNIDIFKKLIDDINVDIDKEDEDSNKPKVIVFTGDMLTDKVDGENTELLNGLKTELKKLKGDHKFAVLGNHDFIAGKDLVQSLLEECGFTVLNNEASDYIEIGDARIQFTGVESVIYGNDDSERLMKEDLAHGVQRIHLVHEPMGIRDVQRYDTRDAVKAVFCGHTHGGKENKNIRRVLRVLEEETEILNGRILSEAGLVRNPGQSKDAFNSQVDLDHLFGIFADRSNRVLSIHPGLGQIYTPSRDVPSCVTKYVLSRK